MSLITFQSNSYPSLLTLQDHINTGGKQFLAAAGANPDHPCHYMLAHQPTPRSIKTTPQALYTELLNTIPQQYSSHIQTHFTNIAIQKLCPNTILGTRPPNYITQNKHYHVRTEHTFAGFVVGITLRWRLTNIEYLTSSTHCGTSTCSLTHFMTHCPALTHNRPQHNISSPLNLWHSSANCLLFLRREGLLGQTS